MNENLWAPWRMAYVRELGRRAASHDSAGSGAETTNFLARYWSQPDRDREHYVIHRNGHGMILLNRYPYANGHLLTALGEARPALMDYDAEQRQAFWKLIERATELMQRTLHPQGINLGINQGEAAGAGVPEHLHAHLVPRWNADTNFITVVGHVRVVPDALESMAEEYRKTVTDSADSRRGER